MSLGALSRSLLVVVTLTAPALAQQTAPPPAPSRMPPAPPRQLPPPPAASPAVAAAPAPIRTASSGQWMYTRQYGWVWAPYDQRYTYVAGNASVAQTYVYYPAFGWRWVASPWVLGLGPAPLWGRLGPGRFAWYAHPWFRGRPYRAWGPGFRGRGYYGWHRHY
jgi:hypothetical protein